MWVKPSAELQFLYGNHVLKSGLGRITEATPGYTGVVVYSMSDVPLGFGVTAKSTADCRSADPNAICVFHQVGRCLFFGGRGGGAREGIAGGWWHRATPSTCSTARWTW